MVEKVFWQDPYLSRLEATIAAGSGNDITLDRTIFYALSGGQESDRALPGIEKIGTVTLKRKNPGKGKARIEIRVE